MTSYKESFTCFFWVYSNWNDQRSHHLEHLAVVQPGSSHRILSLNINNLLFSSVFTHTCMIFFGKEDFTVKVLQLLVFIFVTVLGYFSFAKNWHCCKSVAELVASQIAGKSNTRINSKVRWDFLKGFNLQGFSTKKKKKSRISHLLPIKWLCEATKTKFQKSK